MNKYYVIRTTKNGIEYKKNKCLDTWSKNKNECWQFSKQGAEQITKRLNVKIKEPFWKAGVHYNTLEVTQ